MTALATGLGGKGRFSGGVHPAGRKHLAADAALEAVGQPAEVAIPLLQHTGAPCEAVVKARQEVAWGDLVGNSDAFISAPVHASIAGTVQRESVATLPNGRHVRTVPIKAGDEQPSPQQVFADVLGGAWPTTGLEQYEPKRIREATRDAGIVGLGGAAFPTHVKLMRNKARPIDTLLVNGCECEPYLTADYRLMLEAPGPIVTGALLAARAAGAERVVVAVEDSNLRAIGVMRRAARGTGIQVVSLQTQYPMGGERQTILAALGREVPTGGLPLDVGVVVINVGTAATIARAVIRGRPLTHRVVTVTGAGIVKPKNLLVPIGISYGELIEHCGGLKPEAARVIAGGPMMGFALGSLNVPVTKGTSGVVVLTEEDLRIARETTCIRCGRCVDVCPLDLVPTKLALAAKHEDWDLARRYYITACVECGCCGYVCPAAIPLVQLIRKGKAQMPRE
jgi:electron transport complex protein RnfC